MASSLRQRKVLITGASTGIGAATARLCAREGAHLALIGRRLDPLESLARDVRGVPVAADITDRAQAFSSVNRAAEALGGLDTLINNAGVFLLGGIRSGDFAEWQKMFEVNVLGLLTMTQASLQYLEQSTNADILNISSMAARRIESPDASIYGASKSAVHAISQGLRTELAPNIRVTVVAPGVVRTTIGSEMSDTEALARVRGRQENVGLDPSVVARQVVRALSEPPEVNLCEIAVLATAQPA